MSTTRIHTRCGQCGHEAELSFVSRDYNRKVTNELFKHYRCGGCGVIFIEPVPADLGDYYPEDYHYIPEARDYLARASVPERYKIDIVKRFAIAGRLLEIGPGYGSFTYLAKEAGFEVEAIEMSERCCRFLRDIVGVRAINTNDPISALRREGPYDVIALWHVIEHLPDPWPALDAICACLKRGGVLVLAAPNPDAFQFRVMGRYWPHVDAPRHVMLMPMRVLKERVARLGLRLELATTADPGSVGWNTFGWEFLFANLSTNRYYRHFAFRVGRLLARIFAPIENLEGKGSAYTLVFRKEA